ncbi:MAG TPA: MATE family efflux transporter [Candidatus Faecousia gallistercoris]|nr:MATE family efflux transporter [Candidatus Faecousia gallistercoris]
MNPNKTGDLDSQGIGKLLLRLALPTITAQLVNALYNMVDRIYIGHIPVVGKTALTGVGVCLSLIMIISAFAALTAMGGATRASILLGKGQRDTAERILGNCVTGSVVVGLVLTAVFLSFSRPLLLAFGASEETIVYAVQYMKIYALGTVFVELALGLNAFITAQGFASVAMISVLIGAVANMILDAVLILVFDMGVAGAALATIISQGLSALWVVRFLLGRKTGLRIKKENLRLDWKLYAPCLALGMSPFVMQSTEGVISVCFNASLQKYGGDLAVGAMTILSSVMQFSMLPLQGLTQGAQPIISYNFGAGNADRVRKTFRLLLLCSLAYSVSLWLVAMLLPDLVARIFTPDGTLIAYGAWAMRIYMAASLIFGAQIACQQTFIALGNAKVSLFLAVLRKIILLIPLIFILPLFFRQGAEQAMAVFLAEPVADTLAVVTTGCTFAILFRKTMKNLEEPACTQKA